MPRIMTIFLILNAIGIGLNISFYAFWKYEPCLFAACFGVAAQVIVAIVAE